MSLGSLGTAVEQNRPHQAPKLPAPSIFQTTAKTANTLPLQDTVQFGANRRKPDPSQQPPKKSWRSIALAGVAGGAFLFLTQTLGAPPKGGNTPIDPAFQGPEITQPTPGASSPPPENNTPNTQKRTYQTGQILSSPAEAIALAQAGHIKTLYRVESPQLSMRPFYEIHLKDGTMLALDEPTTDADDQAFILAMRGQGLEVKKLTPQNSPLLNLLMMMAPTLLLIGFFVFMMRRTAGANGAMMKEQGLFEVTAQVPTRFKDVKGYPEVLDELKEVVDMTTAYAQSKKNARPPKGVLLTGPPGTGKTLMGRAMAGESNLPFIYVSGSKFVEMFVGRGAARVRSLFELARQLEQNYGGCYVFIDELDAIGKRRGSGMDTGGGGNDEREGTLNELLVQMDGFEKEHNIIVLAATNRPDVLDPGLVRKGRFDRQVKVDKPREAKDRLPILELYAKKLNLASDVDLMAIARLAKGFVGADLENLAKEAQVHATRRGRTVVSQKDFVDAISRVTLGIARPKAGNAKQKELAAVHEHGHGWMALASKVPLFIVSMIPRGDSLAHVRVDPEEQFGEGVETKDGLLKQLLITIGGRAAETVQYGENGFTSGAGSDLQQFERIFRFMRSTAMLGQSAQNYLEESRSLSAEDRRMMERIYQEALKTGIEIIQKLPQATRDKLVAESLKLSEQNGDLIGEAANKFYRDIVGPDFDWNTIYQLAERFVGDPQGTHRQPQAVNSPSSSSPPAGPKPDAQGNPDT